MVEAQFGGSCVHGAGIDRFLRRVSLCQTLSLVNNGRTLSLCVLTLSYPIKSVKSVTSNDSTNLKQVGCMMKNCAKELAECLADENCRKALDCLNSCKGNDQVCSYRCITSHESPIFERFANCK